MDRNFPGVSRIARLLATGTHVLIRVRGRHYPVYRIGDFLPVSACNPATISGSGITLHPSVLPTAHRQRRRARQPPSCLP